MNRILAAVVAALALALGACSTGSAETAEPSGTPVAVQTEEPTPAPKLAQGPVERDPVDPLMGEAEEAGLVTEYEACTAGDLDSCDTLYLLAPAGSELEEFGDTCGGAQPAGQWCGDAMSAVPDAPAVDDREIFRSALELTLDATDAALMEELCSGIELFGMDLAVDSLRDGFGGPEGFHEDIAVEILTERCS